MSNKIDGGTGTETDAATVRRITSNAKQEQAATLATMRRITPMRQKQDSDSIASNNLKMAFKARL
jgi:hypothetical protein